MPGAQTRYSPEQIEFIRTGYQAMRSPELTRAFNGRFGLDKTVGQILSVITHRRFRCGRKAGRSGHPLGTEYLDERDGVITIKVAEADPQNGLPSRRRRKHMVVWEKARGPVPKGHVVSFIDGNKLNCALDNLKLSHSRAGIGPRYSAEQIEFISTGYRKMRLPELTAAFNARFGSDKTVGLILSAINQHRLRCGRSPGRPRFPLGSEKLEKPSGEVLIKVAEADSHTGAKSRYRYKRIVIWEKVYGPVPKGMVVTFVDGNKLNCALDNLTLRPRARRGKPRLGR